MTQGELQLTKVETVAEVTHLGRDYQLRRADNGQWEIWRRGDSWGRIGPEVDTGCLPQNEWSCIWWVPEQSLVGATTLAELFKFFGTGSPVPPEVMRSFAAAAGSLQ